MKLSRHARLPSVRWDGLCVLAAVVLILLLPLAALAEPPQDASWSVIDPNLVYVRSPPGTVDIVTGDWARLSSADSRPAFVNVATMSTATVLDLNATVSPVTRPSALSVVFSSPYDPSACGLTVGLPAGQITTNSTTPSGLEHVESWTATVDPRLPFSIRASFVPDRPFEYRVVQGAVDFASTCPNTPLAQTVPVNLDLLFTSPTSGASANLTRLAITLPAASNRQYSGFSLLLFAQYAAISLLAILGFRVEILKYGRYVMSRARAVRASVSRFVHVHRTLVQATIIAVFIQVVLAFTGAHPYDMFTQELWSYLLPRSGPALTLPISLVVPGGTPTTSVSPIGSFYPYPPLPLYLFFGVGWGGGLLAAGGVEPFMALGFAVKALWLVFLNATAWVVYLELSRKGLDRRACLLVFLFVALNPGLLVDTMVWGQFEIVVAFFLLLSFVAYGRNRAGFAFFFLLLAVLTKQTGLFAAVFLVPVYIATWGIRRSAAALGTTLVGAFFFLLPLLVAGLSPTYIVRVTTGDILANALSPASVGVALWQQTVSRGALNLWPIVTAVVNGQSGSGRLGYPDYLPNQAFGLPYVFLGAAMALVGTVILWGLIAYAKARRRLDDRLSLLVVIAGFLWIFSVLTRMGSRYLAIVVPLIALLWWSSSSRRLARVLFGGATLVLSLSVLSQLGLTSIQVPVSLSVFQSSSVLSFSDLFVTAVCVVELLVLSLAMIAAVGGARGRLPWPPRVYAAAVRPAPLEEHPQVSVIVLNFNGGELTRRCVASVLADPYPNKEVLVVDNASTDDSLGRLQPYAARGTIHLLRNDVNLQFAEGNNRGGAAATGQLLLFLNNDTEIEPDVLEKMVARFRADATLGAAQPLILFLPQRHLLNSAGATLDTLAFHEVLGLAEPLAAYRPSERTSYAVGAAVMIRREIFARVGGFDPAFRSYYSDVDLSWKVWLSGFKVAVIPEAVVCHAEGSSFRALVPVKRLGMMVQGQLTVVAKNYELGRAMFGTGALLCGYAALALASLLRRRGDMGRAIAGSILSFLATLPELPVHREKIAEFRTLPDSEVLPRFIVPFHPIRVFLRKRRGWGYLDEREAMRID